ncbi:MAG: ATP phosphoribosyltransferase regulatory subunit [Candidatus Coproplasma sp.]
MSKYNSENSVIQALVSLYKCYGYKLYKPSCFEEYSLYQNNKDFLIGKNVIAFSDLSGRLMAMRPDVTLSLIKHSDLKEGELEKYYYDEKVYRQSAGSKEFKEISQVGAEIIGAVDGTSVCEAAILMCQTLSAISDEYVLDVSHMGFTEGLLSEFKEGKQEVKECLNNKNLHDFKKLAQKYGYTERLISAFEIVSEAEGEPKAALKKAEGAVLNVQMAQALKSLITLCDRLNNFGYGDKVKVDFSVTNNADYYNGEVFNGYVNGIYHRILSGGRYDKLIDKFSKPGGAVGFALYLGELDRYFAKEREEVDYLIIYDENNADTALKKADEMIKCGYSVRISNCKDCAIRYKNLICLLNGESEND